MYFQPSNQLMFESKQPPGETWFGKVKPTVMFVELVFFILIGWCETMDGTKFADTTYEIVSCLCNAEITAKTPEKKILLLQLKFDFHVNIFCFQCMKNEGKYIIWSIYNDRIFVSKFWKMLLSDEQVYHGFFKYRSS